MQTERKGALAGRARRARFRKRAARLHAQCLIDEFHEPDPSERRSSRHIPIRGRSDFLPAVAIGSSIVMNRSNANKGDSQLNLPLRHAADTKKRAVVASSHQAKNEPRLVGFDDLPKTEAESGKSEESAIRFTKPRGPNYDLFNLRRFDAPRREPATLGGFLTGCALGTAAASLLLLVLHTVIG